MNPEDVDGIKEAITILENQDTKAAQSNVDESIQIVTPQPVIIDERNNHRTQYSETSAPVYRGTRQFTNSTERRNGRRNETRSQETTDDFKLITVNANMNFTKPSGFMLTENSPKTSAESSERKYRRRMTLRYSPTTQETTTTTTFKPLELTTFTSSLIEIMKQEIQPMENFTQVKQEKLTDQIDQTIVNESESKSPIKRFYRSSAESYKDEKEFEIVNDKKVQIVRPTTSAQLVGQNPSTTAAIAKLDEAVLGSNRRRNTVVSDKTGEFLSPDRGT